MIPKIKVSLASAKIGLKVQMKLAVDYQKCPQRDTTWSIIRVIRLLKAIKSNSRRAIEHYMSRRRSLARLICKHSRLQISAENSLIFRHSISLQIKKKLFFIIVPNSTKH